MSAHIALLSPCLVLLLFTMAAIPLYSEPMAIEDAPIPMRNHSSASQAQTNQPRNSLEDLLGKTDTAGDVLSFIEEETINAATGFSRPTFSSTANVFVLTKKEIEESQARYLADVFRLIPGLDVFEAGIGGDFNISASGMGSHYSNLMLVLIDGAPIILARYGDTPWSSLPLTVTDIERIEVVIGPSTSLYGENAFSGVIDIITRVDMQDAKEHSRATISAGTNGFKRLNVNVTERTKNSVIDARGGWENFDGLTQTSQLPGVTDFEADELNSLRRWLTTSVRHKLDKYRTLDLEIGFNEHHAPSREVLSGLPSIGDSRLLNTVVRYREQINPGQEFRLRLQYMHDESEKKSAEHEASNEDLFDLDISKLVDHRKLRSIFGFTFRGKEAEGYLEPGVHEADTRSVYYQAEYDLDEKWSIFGSIRYFDHTFTDGDISWKLDTRRRLSPNETVRFGSSRAIRFPDLSSLFLKPTTDFNGIPLNIVGLQGNTNLENEEIASLTLGYEKRTKSTTFKLDLFHYEAENLIAPLSTGVPILLQPLPFPFPGIPSGFVQHVMGNIEEPLRSRGVTAYLKKQLNDKFTFTIFGSKRTVKFLNDSTRVEAYAPEYTISTILGFKPNKDNHIQLSYHHMDSVQPSQYGYDPFAFAVLPSFKRFDLAWTSSFEAGKLGLRVTNLFDDDNLGNPVGQNGYSSLLERQISLSWTVEF